MSGNIFGNIFKIVSFGESHGPAIGGVIEGFPAGMKIDISKIDNTLELRRPGQSNITSARNEPDKIEILSGLFNNVTLGTPIGFIIRNIDQKSEDYDDLKDIFRPSHADYTWDKKYGIRDHRGGGRSSARETAIRVVAGSFASQLLEHYGITITAWTESIGNISHAQSNIPDKKDIYQSAVRCPDKKLSKEMEQLLITLKDEGDTTGGIVSCSITNAPVGLGEPVFDKLNADLAKAMFSINAVKGFELGSGFAGISKKGSEHNDAFHSTDGKINTKTNNSGGIQGGISNGEEIRMKIAFKPVSTILMEQDTTDKSGNPTTINATGRHDPCVVPRAVIVVESMASIVLADHILRNRNSKI